MTSTQFLWSSVDRADAAKELIGRSDTGSPVTELARTLAELHPVKDLSLAFVERTGGLLSPAMTVLDNARVDDLFAWLATYAPATFPLSQYVRVLSNDEWAMVSSVPPTSRVDADPIWPSLILGELIAQGNGADFKLTAVPLSRVSLCLGYTQARASTLYRNSPGALRLTAERLSILEKADKQWRAVTTAELREMWALAEDTFTLDPFIRDLVRLLSWTFERNREQRGDLPPVPDLLREISLDLRKLSSGPLEYRVEEFERASAALLARKGAASNEKRRTAAVLAALAIWVGAGTSHITLLAEAASTFPLTFAWFGAFAGALGPASWHPEWARTTAAIAKMLRAGFDVASTSTADLSWTEFVWLANVASFDLLSGVPRVSPKVLSIDVLPGASAPFRLNSDETSPSIVAFSKQERLVEAEPRPASATFAPNDVERVKSTVATATLTDQQLNRLFEIANNLSSVLSQVQKPAAPDEPFELKPNQPQAVKKAPPANRKNGRRATAKKAS